MAGMKNMPCIQTKVNVSITDKQEKSMKRRMGEAISIIPGKSESWLMLDFEDNCHLYFKGTEQPSAFIEVKIYGKSSAQVYDKLTSKLTEIVSSELNIPAERIYVKYEEVDFWGYNGHNF